MKKLIFVFVILIIVCNFNLIAQPPDKMMMRPKFEKKTLFTDKAPAPIGPYSQAVRFGNLLFVSGQIAIDTTTGKIVEGDIKKEATQVMEYLKNVLEQAGFQLDDILKTTIYLTDINNFKIVNEVYASYFKGNFPARETVQVAALPKGAKVEISVIAGEGNQRMK